jgi:hypothetical protein
MIKNLQVRKPAFAGMVSMMMLLVASQAFAAVATVENPQGEVFVRALGSAPDAWKPVSQTAELNNGDSLKTGNGSCTLKYGESAWFTVDPNTSLTIQEESETQDIVLDLGHLRGKVDKTKTVKPFQVVTPAAVAAVRGTEVDFGFNDKGELTVDLHNGEIQVFNDDIDMTLDLEGGRKIVVQFDKEKGTLKVTNDCASAGPVIFSVSGDEFTVDVCKSEEVPVDLETAAGANDPPGTPGPGDDEPTPDENPDIPPPVSPIDEGSSSLIVDQTE